MAVWTPESKLAEYIGPDGKFSEQGAKALIKDADEYYDKFEELRIHDYATNDRIVEEIDVLLKKKNRESYVEIGRIIASDDYKKLALHFNDLNDFRTSAAINETEIQAGVPKTLFDIVYSIDDYIDIRLTTLYCLRRIQLLCPKEDILDHFEELMSRQVSVFFLIRMITEAKLGDKGYVSAFLSELLEEYGRQSDASIIRDFGEKNYSSKDPSFFYEKPYEQKDYAGRKICFVTCENNSKMYEECLYYIGRLAIPQGVILDTISVKDAYSMTSGYNCAMKSSDSDINVFMHQDVCILNPYFLYDLLDIFASDEKIGLVGMVGSPSIPPDAVMWHGVRVGSLYGRESVLKYEKEVDRRYQGLSEVEALDGLLIASNRKIPFREDIFDGWDFYDASICEEYHKMGYKVVVPNMVVPWVIHDDGIMNLYSYGKYRKIFLNEYFCHGEKEKTMESTKERLTQLINEGDYDRAYELLNEKLHSEIDKLKNDPQYCVLAATVLLQKEAYDKALDMITIGLIIDDHNYELYLTLGEYYVRSNTNQALLCFYQAYFYCDVEEDKTVIEDYISEVKAHGANIRNVSVVIVSKNQSEELKSCMNSVVNTLAPDMYEIVIVDNGSSDETQKWISEIEGITYYRSEHNLGYVKAVNAGIKLSDPFNDVFLLDADCSLPDNAFFYLMLGLYSSENVGVVGGITNDYINEQKMHVDMSDPKEAQKIVRSVNCPIRDAYEKACYISDHAMLIRREALEKVGIFDDTFSPDTYEDKDFCTRVHLADMEVILCFNSYIFKHADRHRIYGANCTTEEENKKLFKEKWGFNIDYSSSVRFEILKMIRDEAEKPLEVLELGSALGSTLNRISRMWPKSKVHGVEYDSDVVRIAEHMSDIIRGDVENMEIPYSKGQFDYIICADVLEHLRNPKRTIERFLPYLKKGGHFIISLPNIRHYGVLMMLMLEGRFDYSDSGILDATHLKFFTKDTAKEMIESTGLEIVDIQRGFNGHPEDNEFITLLTRTFNVTDPDELKVFQYYFLAKK